MHMKASSRKGGQFAQGGDEKRFTVDKESGIIAWVHWDKGVGAVFL